MTRFPSALDVACGTGQSSRALAEIADHAYAVDVSPAMLAETKSYDRIRYCVASAEAIPFHEASFDLATVGLAFHWFHQTEFLLEAHRVLKEGAWLVIYTSGFLGEMGENSEFSEWAQNVYPEKFPTPSRYKYDVTVETVEPFGFRLQSMEHFTHNESMRAEQLTGYLLTQTNVIAAVESGTLPLATAANWIQEGIEPFFNNNVRTMKFGGSISFLQRTEVAAR